jgi:hypothetical protein
MDSDRPTSFRGFADFLQLIFQHNNPFPWILGAVLNYRRILPFLTFDILTNRLPGWPKI